MVHDFTDGHARILDEHQIGGKNDDQHRSHLFHKALDAVVVKTDPAGFHLILRHLILDVQLLARLDALPVEGLDDADGVDDVLDALALGFQVMAHLPSPSFEPPRLTDGNPEIHRHDGQGHQPHIDIGGEHEDKGQEGAGEKRQQVDKEILHRTGQTAHALVYTGLHLSGGVVVLREKGHAEGKHLFNHRLRKVPGHENAHALPVIVLRKSNKGRQHFLPQQHRGDDGKDARRLVPAEIRADESVDGVHRPVQDNGVHLLHERAHQGED